MSVDPLYITPHETALAVIATSMKKSRLTLQTLIINSVMGGVLFSSGGMLYSIAVGNNPELSVNNPGLLSILGGLFFGIGLFYVIINGCDLFNSNILFFTVGLLRNAVNVYDLTISWAVSWLGNLAGSLFMSYVICHLSGSMKSENLKQGTIDIAEFKLSFSFVEVFLKGVAGNFFVCLAVYLQLMSKPMHVKFLTIILPVFTFVTSGFTHTVAEMFLIPTGMFNGANISVKLFIWKNLIPASVGNIVGGMLFSLTIPYYLHLYVVEQDRKLLQLPEYDAFDEQPEINVDSRVVKAKPRRMIHKIKKINRKGNKKSKYSSSSETSSPSSKSASYINPPGVFPIEGFIPLTKEKTIMNGETEDEYEEKNMNNDDYEDDNSEDTSSVEIRTEDENTNEDGDAEYDLVEPYTPDQTALNLPETYNSYSNQDLADMDVVSTMDSLDLENQQIKANKSQIKDMLKEKEKSESEEYEKTGGYNPEKNKLGTKLSKIFTSVNEDVAKSKKMHTLEKLKKTLSNSSNKLISKKNDSTESKLNALPSKNNKGSSQPPVYKDPTQSRRSSLASSRHSLSSKAKFRRELKNQNMTNKALMMADPVAGSVDLDESFVQRPSRLRRKYSYHRHQSPAALMRNYGYDNDNSEEQSIGD